MAQYKVINTHQRSQRFAASQPNGLHLLGEDLVRGRQVVDAAQVALRADHPVALVPARRVAATHVAAGSRHDVCASLVRGPVANVTID